MFATHTRIPPTPGFWVACVLTLASIAIAACKEPTPTTSTNANSNAAYTKKQQPADPASSSPTAPSNGAAPAAVVEPSGQTRQEAVDRIRFDVPVEWVKQRPKSRMRLAQFVLPGAAGEGTLVIYKFPGGAGSVDANIGRWQKQFKTDAGGLPEVSRKQFEQDGIKITQLRIDGRYVAPKMPMNPQGPRFDEADWAMLGAVVENIGDSLYIKVVGPKETLDQWSKAFTAFLKSIQVLA